VRRATCDRCGRDIVWVAEIPRPLDPVPQPYVEGAPGWALTYSRGWVQSNNQLRPPKEHLVEHFWICSERMAVRDVTDVTETDTAAALPTPGPRRNS
jgi:hypothetical protein